MIDSKGLCWLVKGCYILDIILLTAKFLDYVLSKIFAVPSLILAHFHKEDHIIYEYIKS